MRLREYRERDFGTLCEIDARCFTDGLHYPRREMRAFLRVGTAVVAENRLGRVVAFLAAAKNRVVTVDVLPEYRRRGIARALMDAAEARMRAAGAPQVLLEVGVRNRAAQALYRSLGYTRVKRLTNYYPNGSDAWLMEKRLDVRAKTERRAG